MERNNTQPPLIGNSIIIEIVEYAELYFIADVVGMKFGFVMKYLPSPIGEG